MSIFPIINRWTGDAIFKAELGAEYDSASRSVRLGAAVKLAFKARVSLRDADLSGAVLSGADLRGADLRGADLRGAVLRGAVLSDAVLSGADLSDADLSGADLRGAVLSGADLSGADLSGAVLSGADLRGADLRGAVLSDADLSGADLRGAVLRPIRTDLFDVLLRAQAEVPALLQALREGRIDGSTYHGACACLAGTIANVRAVNVEDLDFRDADRPIERWFLGIKKGDTPESNPVAKITEGWIEEFLALTGAAQPQESR